MKTLSAMVLTAACVIAGDASRDAARDMDKLQGLWTIDAVHNKGEQEKTTVGTTARFAGNKVTFTVGDEKDTTEFKIDSTKKPGWFDITGGPYKSVGIYELEGDTLKVCLNQSGKTRPTAFKSEKEGPNERLFVLKSGKR